MQVQTDQLLPLVVATSFAAGINVYATVFTLGLLSHAGLYSLPPSLHVLDSWWCIAVSGALFLIEVFADKIPYFDVVWNFLHTFIRVPVAALLAYGATSQLPPAWQLLASGLGAAIAFGVHSGKTALRIGVNTSPEPFSNVAVSTVEDGASIGLTWLATVHPFLAASIALAGIVVLLFAIRWIVRSLGKGFALLRGDLQTRPAGS